MMGDRMKNIDILLLFFLMMKQLLNEIFEK